jgi:integrase
VKGAIRHARRDLSPDELGRLLDAARASRRTFRGLVGNDRHFLYLTACATGFRVSELATMTPESFNLDGDMPTATVEASCTKNRKEAVQPLPLDIAKALREFVSSKPANVPVWSGKWQAKAARMIRADLKEARKNWLQSFQDACQRTEAEQSDFLTYKDGEGRYADFHALRHSFITMVGKAGVSAREHQDLARHSTYALTSKYSHSRFYDLSAAVQGLPIRMVGPGTEPQSLAATGTDGRAEKSGPFLGPRRAISADFGGQTRTEAATVGSRDDKGKTKESLIFPVQAVSVEKMGATGFEPVTPSVSS